MRTAIAGGGAAGFFMAVNLKEMAPGMDVCIFERGSRVLRKVAVSGGGRCNCTNSFRHVESLETVYPRGHRLMGRLMRTFGPEDAFRWFERHGVELVTQDDGCVFPRSQDARAITGCLASHARRLGVEVRTGLGVGSLSQLQGFDFVAVAAGGSPRADAYAWLAEEGVGIEPPVPSLFSLGVDDEGLRGLMGTVVEDVAVQIPSTRFRARGALLATHWGMSGPAVLRLSSYAARHLAERGYSVPVAVNWTGRADAEVADGLRVLAAGNASRQLATARPFALPQRLWHHLLRRALGGGADAAAPSVGGRRWGELGKKDINRLVNVLVNDTYAVSGRAPHHDEFVTCGGVSLSSVNPLTLESRARPRLFFAGEVLDIDGVTGGFNFQAAWTTAYVAAREIARQAGACG